MNPGPRGRHFNGSMVRRLFLSLAIGSVYVPSLPAQPVYAEWAPRRPVDRALYAADLKGDVPRVKKLLSRGANANVRVFEGNSLLFDAVQRWTPHLDDVAELLLNHGAKADFRSPVSHEDVLETTFSMGTLGPKAQEFRLADMLLRHGAKVDPPGYEGKTLTEAVLTGSPELVSLVLDHGAHPNAWTPVHQDSMPSNIAYPERVTQSGGETPIFKLAMKWSPAIYQRLVAAGADAHARDAQGWDLLLAAAWVGNRPEIEYLLSHGWKINDATAQGSTPLHLAMVPPSGYPKVELVKLLIAKGVDPAAKNNLGQTAEGELRKHATRLMLRQELALAPIENDVYAKVANEVLQLLRPGAPPIPKPQPRS